MSAIFGFEDDMEVRLAYPEGPDEGYTLRPITDDLLKDWDTKTKKIRFKSHQRVEERDQEAYDRLLYDHLIAGWDGAVYLCVADARAQRTAECTLANKLRFAATQPDRILWMMQEARTMGDRLAREIEQQRDSFRGADGLPAGAGAPPAGLSDL